MARYFVVPMVQRAAVRRVLLEQLAQQLGRPIGPGGIDGDPPGRGATTQAVPERLSRDGLLVAFELETSDGRPLEIRNPRTRDIAMRPLDLAGALVRGTRMPAVADRGPAFFPDPPEPGE